MKQPSLFDDLLNDAMPVKKTKELASQQHSEWLQKDGMCFLLNIGHKISRDPELLGIALCRKNGFTACYIPIKHDNEDNLPEALSLLKPYFEDPAIIKISHDIKSQMSVLKRKGIDIKGNLKDTMIASYLLDPNKSNHGLQRVVEEYLERVLEVQETKKRTEKKVVLSLEESADLFCERVVCIQQLHDVLFPRLMETGLEKIYLDLEMPIISILSNMELKGIRIDPNMLYGLSKEISGQLERIEGQIYELAGERFNINSPQQLSHILFDKIGLKPARKTKTGYSTDNDTLQQLAVHHKLPEEIVKYRLLFKLKNTYIDALPPLAEHSGGRIHTTFNQTATATGRLSSSDPNLQNIPVRGEWGIRIREAFIAKEGCLLLSSDYSQIELRLLAHLSADEKLIESFKEDIDIHTATASLLFKVDKDRVDREMRRVAKVVNFGIIYGMSPFGLSEALRIGTTEASEYIDRYFRLYSGVKQYIENTIRSVKETGFAFTLFGRRRAIVDINSSNSNLRQQSERIAVNTPIQGSAADLIKIAMIRVDRAIRERGILSEMVLQIHDELLFEIPIEEIEVMKALVKIEMEGAASLLVPLKVDIRVGSNWGIAH